MRGPRGRATRTGPEDLHPPLTAPEVRGLRRARPPPPSPPALPQTNHQKKTRQPRRRLKLQLDRPPTTMVRAPPRAPSGPRPAVAGRRSSPGRGTPPPRPRPRPRRRPPGPGEVVRGGTRATPAHQGWEEGEGVSEGGGRSPPPRVSGPAPRPLSSGVTVPGCPPPPAPPSPPSGAGQPLHHREAGIEKTKGPPPRTPHPAPRTPGAGGA